MNNIVLFIKGLFIGLGKIIPGVSGSLLAIYLNVYECAIDKLCNLFKNFKQNLIYFLFLGSGIGCSIIFFSNITLLLLNKHFLLLMSLIIGFLLGMIPKLYREISVKKINNLLYFLIPLLFLKILNLNFSIEENFFSFLLLGLIEALTTIIPGISGTAIYLMLNCYDSILKLFSNPFSFDFIIFMISFFLSFILLANVINFVLKKYNNEAKIIIFSFSLFSIVTILKSININPFSVFLIVIGFLISTKINSYLE